MGTLQIDDIHRIIELIIVLGMPKFEHTLWYVTLSVTTLAPEREAFSFTPALAGGARECR
jgi:hypothetical protein